MDSGKSDSYEEYLDQYFLQDDRTVSIFEYTLDVTGSGKALWYNEDCRSLCFSRERFQFR